ncbi:MAG: uncharacterized protein QOI13_1331 [Paraburkholderia sp.]|nr:uncharacterized protein [Paraburkholderia sp.]
MRRSKLRRTTVRHGKRYCMRRNVATILFRLAIFLRGTPPRFRGDHIPVLMLRLSEIKLPLDHAESDLEAAIRARLADLGVPADGLLRYTVFRRAHDARKRSDIRLTYTVDVEVQDEAAACARLAGKPNCGLTPDMAYRFVAKAPEHTTSLRPVVIGMGPCGLFAGLILAQMGFQPIILERGKAVRERTKDTFGLWRKAVLNPESNVQFGEGGAGTFSDGKLYSQIKDPNHYGRKVLNEFVKAGAPEDILSLSRPHIGTFRLVSMVEKMRANIQELGGEVRFETRVDDIEIDQGKVRSLKLSNGETLRCDHVVLAVGHSARDTFQMLHERGVYTEAKPFSLGFRIEHPQGLIDRSRFGKFAGHKQLGAADYKVVHHCSNGRAVYSFCMCPGGTVVAATSERGRVVTNGMSQYSRAERNANAGIVVGITPEDYPGGALAGIAFQRKWEERAFELGGGDYHAPGQLVGDFIAGRPSTSLGSVVPSYKPGVRPTDLSTALPDYVIEAIREALPQLDKKIAGFAMHDAVLTGVETRTSSPIRIRRRDDYQSMNVEGLYPAGEGAGYAGGIYSAAIDGIEVAQALALNLASAHAS